MAGDAASPENWWDGVPFDRILLDAPCSALGVIRRHPDIRLRRSPNEIDKMPKVQVRLLAAAWRMLARGGRLVYATCTLTRSENRGVDRRLPRRDPGCEKRAAGGVGRLAGVRAADGFGRQILPGEAGADGFYYAALTKR